MEQGTKQQQRPQQQNHHQDNAVVVGDKHCMDPTNNCMDPTNSAETRIWFFISREIKTCPPCPNNRTSTSPVTTTRRRTTSQREQQAILVLVQQHVIHNHTRIATVVIVVTFFIKQLTITPIWIFGYTRIVLASSVSVCILVAHFLCLLVDNDDSGDCFQVRPGRSGNQSIAIHLLRRFRFARYCLYWM